MILGSVRHISPHHSSVSITIIVSLMYFLCILSHSIKVLEHPKKGMQKIFYNNWEISCSLIYKPVVWPLAWQIFLVSNYRKYWYLLSVVSECEGIAWVWWQIVCQFVHFITFVSFTLVEKMDPFLLFCCKRAH